MTTDCRGFEIAPWHLRDLHHKVANGLRMASLAGAWLCCVFGFGGVRDHGGELSFAPRLPANVERLAFRIIWRGSGIAVEITGDSATYRLLSGDAFVLRHHGRFTTLGNVAVPLPIPRQSDRLEPLLPEGRAPYRRR